MRKLILFLFFILQGNVQSTIGIKSELYLYTLLILGIITLFRTHRWKDTIEFKIFAVFIILLIYRYYTGILPGSFRYACNIIIPCLISLALPSKVITMKEVSIYKFAFNLLIIFFILEILIAIYETATHSHLLQWVDVTYESHFNKIQDRPIGLVGAPLGSTHILACLSFFILNLPIKNKYKYSIWLLNFLGLLLYQGRMGIVASLLYLMFYFCVEWWTHKLKTSSLIAGLCITSMFIVGMFCLGLGSRLFTTDDSGSAEMRFEALVLFEQFSWNDFLLGNSLKTMEIIQIALGVTVIEIFELCHFILYGIIFSVTFYLLYYKLYNRNYITEQKILKTGTFIVFFLLLSTSISWFSSFSGMTFFCICSKLLNEESIKRLIPNKYINNHA